MRAGAVVPWPLSRYIYIFNLYSCQTSTAGTRVDRTMSSVPVSPSVVRICDRRTKVAATACSSTSGSTFDSSAGLFFLERGQSLANDAIRHMTPRVVSKTRRTKRHRRLHPCTSPAPLGFRCTAPRPLRSSTSTRPEVSRVCCLS